MGSMHERVDPARSDHDYRAAGVRLVEALAGALRAEFGVGIDAHPGGLGAEAGVVNRAFLTAAGVILGGVVSTGDDPAAVLTWAMRQAALRRLHELGASVPQAEALVGMEPALGDPWLAYLTLAPGSVIDDLMAGGPG